MTVNLSDQKFFELLKPSSEAGDIAEGDFSIDDVREAAKQFKQYAGDASDIPFKDLVIEASAGHQIRLRYYINGEIKKPLIVYLPGNAFVHDLFEENHAIISKVAKKADCNAVMIECRLAPENPYPKPLEDALEAIEYIYSHCADFNAYKDKLILAGFSSGANLAAVSCNQLRFSHINIFHQVLISGAYDYTDSLHDYDKFSLQDKMLDPVAAKFSFDCYSKEEERKDPMCSPYWEKDLSGLPDTTIVVAEYDGGRSQSEAYAQKLIEAGNNVDKIILPGQTHGTILYRKACCDGEDPAIIVGKKIKLIIE